VLFVIIIDANPSSCVKGIETHRAAHPAHVQFFNPPTLPSPPGYTQVVQVTGGRTIYIAGQIALDRSGQVVGRGDFCPQAEQEFENLQAALAAAGADFTQVVKLNDYLIDVTQLPSLRDVRDRYVHTQFPPASTLVEVRKLVREELLLEVEAIASLPA
jgi:enamine deaminase RidA (YjgF/YER057c/UK114 family)